MFVICYTRARTYTHTHTQTSRHARESMNLTYLFLLCVVALALKTSGAVRRFERITAISLELRNRPVLKLCP